MENANVKKSMINGKTMKIWASIIMFIDHIGAVIIERLLVDEKILAMPGYSSVFTDGVIGTLGRVDMVLRYIGRIAFPLFVFLLVEGFVYTHNRMKYALRLLLFALVSEVPFDIANNGKVLEFTHQNVFFTLLIGFLVLMAIDKLSEVLKTKWVWVLTTIVIVIAGMALAHLAKTDYDMFGVLSVYACYLLKRYRKTSFAVVCGILTMAQVVEIFAFLGLPIIARYDGTRGKVKCKYLFYLFYPGHLLFLALVRMLLVQIMF